MSDIKTVSVEFTHDEIETVATAIVDAVDVLRIMGANVPPMIQGLYTKVLAAHAVVCPSADGLIPAEVLAYGIDSVTVNGITVNGGN